MDVICLSEIGPISGMLEHALSKWMTPAAAPDTQFPLIERMLRQLVDDAAEWKVYAMAHYGLLVNSTSVKLVQEPSLVGLHKPHPARVAMKFQISPLTGGVEKPAEATEIWNIHCPASQNHPYGPDARRGVWKTITETSASRSVIGGDMNMSRFQVIGFNMETRHTEATRQWKVHEPMQAKHGDLALTRNVVAEPMHMTIGRDYIGDRSKKSSDAHNACALMLTYAVQRETRVARNTPVLRSSHPCSTTISVAKPDSATSKPTSVRTSTVGRDTSVATPSQDEHDAHVPPASGPHPPTSGETGVAKPGLAESPQVHPCINTTSVAKPDSASPVVEEQAMVSTAAPLVDASHWQRQTHGPMPHDLDIDPRLATIIHDMAECGLPQVLIGLRRQFDEIKDITALSRVGMVLVPPEAADLGLLVFRDTVKTLRGKERKEWVRTHPEGFLSDFGNHRMTTLLKSLRHAIQDPAIKQDYEAVMFDRSLDANTDTAPNLLEAVLAVLRGSDVLKDLQGTKSEIESSIEARCVLLGSAFEKVPFVQDSTARTNLLQLIERYVWLALRMELRIDNVPPASVPQPPMSDETSVAKPGLDESSQVLTRPQPPLALTSIDPRDFSDAIPDEGELDCHGQPHIDAPLVVMLSTAMDGSTGPPAEADTIESLLSFLWWGNQFHAKDDDAFVKAGQRLAENLQWIQQIREDYAPNRVPKPVSRQHQFEPTEVAEMHNRYMNSLHWMPESVRDTYEQLQAEAQQSVKGRGKDSHGKGKGKGKGEATTSSSVEKPAGKQISPARRAHNLKKQTFNVCFFKAFGSKTLFWHLVKVGPDTQDLNELLRVWSEVKSGSAYQELLEASLQKSEDVAEMKKRLEWCRRQMVNAKRYYAPKEEYDKAVAAYETAKLDWKALNRNTQHRGMHELLVAEE